MLIIRANGIAIQLSSNTELNLIFENPFLQTEKLPVPYSLDLQIEPTSENLKTFGYPNRINSIKQLELSAEIEFSGVIFLKGLLTVKGFDQTIKTSFKGISIFSDLQRKLTDLPLANYNLGKNQYVNIGTIARPLMVPKTDRNDVNNIAYKYKELYKSSTAYDGDFVAAPVRLTDNKWKYYLRDIKYADRSGTLLEFKLDVILPTNTADNQYLNFYNPVIQDFNLTRNYIKTASAGAGVTTELSDYVNTRNFPFPTLKYIFDQAFSGVLTANPFNEAELNKLVLVTNYHPNWKEAEYYMQNLTLQGMLLDKYFNQADDQDHFISLNKFMPDYGVNDLLKSLMKIFCLSGFIKNGKIEIKKNAEVLADTLVVNWNDKLIAKPTIAFRSAMFYKYGYANIKDETAEGLTLKEVATVKAMHDAELEVNKGYTSYFKITSTGEVYKKEYADAALIYTRLQANMGSSADEPSDKDSFDMTSNIEPLPMTVGPYWTDLPVDNEPPASKFWYVPQMEDKRAARNSDINIMFYRGMKNTFETGEQYPMLLANNIDQFGARIGNYSLQWNGDDGLIEKFHKEYREWIQEDKITINHPVLLNVQDLKELDMSKKISLGGKNFFIQKVQISISINTIKPALVDFIEA